LFPLCGYHLTNNYSNPNPPLKKEGMNSLSLGA
jgi:hypothetical protein